MLEPNRAGGCPYCETVRDELTELEVSYVNHTPRTVGGDSSNERTRAELEVLGGEDQRPFLVDTARGETLHVSGALVDSLEPHDGRANAAQ